MVKSFRGREVNIAVLKEKQGASIAVGNLRVNANGDLLGRGGKILKTRQQLENEYVKNNPNAVKQKKDDIVGYNKGLSDYEEQVMSHELAKADMEKPADPYKETSQHNKNLSTSKTETVKFTDSSVKEDAANLDALPLDEEFEIYENPEPKLSKDKKGK